MSCGQCKTYGKLESEMSTAACKTTKQIIVYEEKSRCSLINVYPGAMRCRAF